MSKQHLYTTLPVNPNNGWQACREVTGWWAQHLVSGPHEYAVETTCHDGELLMFHGPWDLDDAQRYARSMGDGDRSVAAKVEPYYFCYAWGVVPTASVHELDEECVNDWSKRPAAVTVLGCEVRS